MVWNPSDWGEKTKMEGDDGNHKGGGEQTEIKKKKTR